MPALDGQCFLTVAQDSFYLEKVIKNRSIACRKMLIFNILCRSDAAGY
jgi:hypothetical protein